MIKIPSHIGLIPDGNRRWAQKNKMELSNAYVIALQKVAEICDEVFELGSSSFSVYLLSSQNLQRPPDDLGAVISAGNQFLREILPPVAKYWNAGVRFCGSKRIAPISLWETFHSTYPIHKMNKHTRSIYLLIGYDPIVELASAVNNISGYITEPILLEHLYMPHRLDIVIRTSGEYRLSSFLPVQSGYAELFFVQKLFPELLREDIRNIYHEYQVKRLRRFGQ